MECKNGQAFLIFSGINQRAVISFCRVAKKNNIDFFIIANGEKDTIFLTEYKDRIVYIREKNKMNINYIEKIIKEVRKKINFKKINIVPNSEYIMRFIYDNLDSLENIGVDLRCLVGKSIYESISDKNLFCNLCNKHGIKVPKVIGFNEIDNYPVVVKPRNYFSRDKKVYSPQIINGKCELNKYLSNKSKEDFFIQEYIEGESIYLLFYIGKDHEIKYSQKNILQQPNGKSMIYCRPIKFDDCVYRTFIKLFRFINYTGLVMVEVKKHKDDFIMIEANPRLWGPIQLTIDNNVPIIETFIKDCGFPIFIDGKDIVWTNNYYWNGGYVMSANNKIKTHDYTEMFDLDELCKIDIYNRSDTKKIYELELGEKYE